MVHWVGGSWRNLCLLTMRCKSLPSIWSSDSSARGPNIFQNFCNGTKIMLELRSLDGNWPTDKLLEDSDFRLFEVFFSSSLLRYLPRLETRLTLEIMRVIGTPQRLLTSSGEKKRPLEVSWRAGLGSFPSLSTWLHFLYLYRASFQSEDIQTVVSFDIHNFVSLFDFSLRNIWHTTSCTKVSSKPWPFISKIIPPNGMKSSLQRAATLLHLVLTLNHLALYLSTQRWSILSSNGCAALVPLESLMEQLVLSI